MAKLKRSEEKRDFWKLVFDEYHGSGLSVRAFCEREGLAEPSFYAWRKRLLLNDAVGVNIATDDVAQRNRLVPVRIVAEDRSQHSQSHSRSQASAQMEIRTPVATRYVSTEMLRSIA